MPRRAVIGVGNVLLSDEGVGVHAVRALVDRSHDDDLLVLDGGTEGLGLMDVIAGLERLVVIDCVRGGSPPGTVYCFDWDELGSGLQRPRPVTTAHQVTLADLMTHVALVTTPPRTTVVGVEPASLEPGLELSDPVRAQLERICTLSLEQVAKS